MDSISKLNQVFHFIGIHFSWLVKMWSAYSKDKLEQAESAILKDFKTPYRGFFVNIERSDGKTYKIWTLAFNEESKEIPLLRIHGLGGASAFWALNFDEIAKHRPTYAIDNLGFGKSSRPTFSTDPLKAEEQYVETLEAWRKAVNIKKFYLVGHSMGGFLSFAYALKYPQNIQHLILVDPWGIQEKTSSGWPINKVDLTYRMIYYTSLFANPYFGLRFVGPFAYFVVNDICKNLINNFSEKIADKNIWAEYLLQCNLRRPTGETAFSSMMDTFFWAKHPMIKRINDINKELPMTFIYGDKSFIDAIDENIVKEARPKSYTKLYMIKNCGHDIYVEQPEELSQLIIETCKI